MQELYYFSVGSKLVKIYDVVGRSDDKLEVYETKLGFKMYLSRARTS
jgi:predicted DNA-binding protein YlxM (UPF0122 family)